MSNLLQESRSFEPRLGQTLPKVIGMLGACAVVGLVMLLASDLLGPFYARLLQQVGVFVIAAISLTIVNGFTGQFSMGHAGFMAIGGYIAASTTYYGSLMWYASPAAQEGILSSGHLLLLGGLVLGGSVAAAMGYLVGLPSLRLRGDYLAIVTLGFGEIVRVVLQLTSSQVVGTDAQAIRAFTDAPMSVLATLPLGGSLGFSGVPGYANNLVVWTIVAATFVFAIRLKNSSSGRAFLSIREDEIAARAMGVDLTKYKVRAFVLSAAIAGVAGGLIAHAGVPLQPQEAGFQRSFEIIIMVVLGGLGSVSGAAIAAIVLTTLPEALRFLQDYRLILYAVLLIVVMLVRPKGLLGVREIWEVGPWARKSGKNGRAERSGSGTAPRADGGAS